MSTPHTFKGLDGVIADTTAISQVTAGDVSSLVYRGYAVDELADRCSFEEVAYLLLFGELPTVAEREAFEKTERSLRALPDGLVAAIEKLPRDAHPLDAVRTAVSWLGMSVKPAATTPRQMLDAAVDLLAKLPTIVATLVRLRAGKSPARPRADLGFSANFLAMCEHPADAVVAKAFDVSMVLYAEHSFNASTFTARVIVSTMSDLYSAVCGAIGALKGPLHGGANEAVMHMLKEIGEVGRAETWVRDALASEQKIMGFGHRVYKKQDSRAPTMQRYGLGLAEHLGEMRWHNIAAVVERTMIEEKEIYPNLDFPAGPAYHLMGFDTDFFTPFFVMSRIVGWSAHSVEQATANRLIRPLSEYVGPAERSVPERPPGG